jgi:hypothetical protein
LERFADGRAAFRRGTKTGNRMPTKEKSMPRRSSYWLLTLFMACLNSSNALADVRLPKIFTDNMVLQQELPIAVWGWADAGEQVTVSLAGKSVRTKAGRRAASWRVDLPAMQADGKTHELTIQGKKRRGSNAQRMSCSARFGSAPGSRT